MLTMRSGGDKCCYRLCVAATSSNHRLWSRDRDPIEYVYASVTFLIPAIVSLVSRMGSVDLSYHVRAGNMILHSGTIPITDSFTFTVAGAAWPNHQWGAQLLLALLHRAGSWATLAALRALLAGLSFALVYLACRASGVSSRTASLLTFGGYVLALPALALRPQLFAVPLVALTLWALASRSERPARLWIIPVVAVACANVHGSFVLLVVLVGFAWLDDVLRGQPGSRRLLIVGALTAAGTLVNPFGVSVWTYAYQLSRNSVVRHNVTEWAPVNITKGIGPYLAVSALAVLAAFIWRRRFVSLAPVLQLLFFFTLAMVTQRAVLWWAIVAPVTVAALWGRSVGAQAPATIGRFKQEPVAPAIVVIGALVAIVIGMLPWWTGSSFERRLELAPSGITRAIQADLAPGSRLLAYQAWGSWLEYAVPADPVFVDTRIDIIPLHIWKDYGKVAFGRPGWRDVLEHWHVDAIVADKKTWTSLPELRNDPAWRVAFEDKEGVLFVRASLR